MSVIQTSELETRSGALGAAGATRPSLRFLFVALVLLGFALLLGALYGRLMMFGLRRDEMMFVPPAEFLPGLRLYSDVFYNHAPNSAWYYHYLHLVFGDLGVLGAARTGVFLAWIVLVLAIAWTTFRISRSWMLAAFSAIAVIAADPLLSQAGMAATNNLLPLPLAVLGTGLFVSETLGRRPRFSLLVLAGICLSLAAGTKVSAVIFIPPLAIAAFLLPTVLPFRDRLTITVLPLAVGGLIGALPVLWYLASDPQLFLAHVLHFHTGPHVTYWEANAANEANLALGLGGKIRLALQSWLAGGPLVLATVLVYLFWVALSAPETRARDEGDVRGHIVLILGMIALTAAFSFVPSPGFPQYYVQPLVLLPILGALLYRCIGRDRKHQVMPVLGAAMLVMLIVSLPRLGPGLAGLSDTNDFTSARISRGGQELQQTLAANNVPEGPIATFLPIYPMEAGLGVYPEFATGQFAYRIAPYTEESLARSYRMVGADGLSALFGETPPAAFLLGYEPELEAPLLQYALENGYREVPVPSLSNRYGDGRFFVRTAGGQE